MTTPEPIDPLAKQKYQQHLIFTAILTGETHHLDDMHKNNNDLHVAAQFLSEHWQNTQTPQARTENMIDLIRSDHREELAKKYTQHLTQNPYPPSDV